MAAVLIVDDERDARDALREYLAGAGYAVTCVGNGQAALNSILTRAPDVIVLDLLMPQMDGPTLLEVVRSYLRLQSIPVVVWTGAPPGEVIDRARSLNVSMVLTKPSATFPQIRAAIDKAVGSPAP